MTERLNWTEFRVLDILFYNVDIFNKSLQLLYKFSSKRIIKVILMLK